METCMEKQEFYLEQRNHILIVHICEEVDHHLARAIRLQVDYVIDHGVIDYLIMDFQGVHFMDSSGIGLIMGRYKRMKFLQGELRLSSLSAELKRILSLSGIYRFCSSYETLEQALEGTKR